MADGYITIKDISFMGEREIEDEIISECYYSFKKKGLLAKVDYVEDLSPDDKCTSALTVNNDGVVILHRAGPFSTNMVFEKGERHICNYVTPVGVMNIGIDTLGLTYDFNKNGGTLELEYYIDCDADKFARKKLIISVEAKQEEK